MKGAFLAAAVQMNSRPDIAANLAQAETLLLEAAAAGAHFAALPEAFPFLGPEAELRAKGDAIAREAGEFLESMARRTGMILAAGIYTPAGNGRLYNTLRVVAGDGSTLAEYYKIHLFDVQLPDGVGEYRESRNIAAGDSPALVDLPGLARVGLSICYDIRFPELYRTLSAAGAEALLIPAAFTAFTGRAHWELLLRARAVENLCYAIAPAQCGRHYGDRESFGHAMIVDPWGDVIADAGERPGLAIATIDADRLSQVRSRLPALEHRRLYPSSD